MKRILILFFLFLVLSSHELFLKSDNYFLKANQATELYLFNGTFDKSENVITRDRIVKAKILGPDYQFLPKPKDYKDREAVTYLNFKTGKAGTYVAGISTKPRNIELDAKAFGDYLEHEGLSEVIADRKQKGISDQSALEKYSKHVKAILQVGDERSAHYAQKLGYPIEFIPLKNPYELQVNDEMSFKLLFQGKPLKNQTVHYSFRQGAQDVGKEENSTRTNNKGELSFKISGKGQWYVATIHMLESKEGKIDYESNWATLTFEVK